MNKLKYFFCNKFGNGLFEFLVIVFLYLFFSYMKNYFTVLRYDYLILVLSIAFGRVIFSIINYIFYQKLCEKFTLNKKISFLLFSILIIFVSFDYLYYKNKENNIVLKNIKGIKDNQIKLYIYQGRKANGNRKLKYDINIDNFLNIKDLQKNKIVKVKLSPKIINEFKIYIKKLNLISSILRKGFGHPHDFNIDIRTSKNLIVFPLSNIEFIDLNKEEQKIIKEFLKFVKTESNNSIDLNYKL